MEVLIFNTSIFSAFDVLKLVNNMTLNNPLRKDILFNGTFDMMQTSTGRDGKEEIV